MGDNILLWILLFCNLIAFLAFGIDKVRAIRQRRRISEKALLTFSLFGGIGAFLGMAFFRHKIRKLKFRIILPLLAMLNGLLAWFLSTALSL